MAEVEEGGELGLLGLRLVREACLSSFLLERLVLPLGGLEVPGRGWVAAREWEGGRGEGARADARPPEFDSPGFVVVVVFVVVVFFGLVVVVFVVGLRDKFDMFGMGFDLSSKMGFNTPHYFARRKRKKKRERRRGERGKRGKDRVEEWESCSTFEVAAWWSRELYIMLVYSLPLPPPSPPPPSLLPPPPPLTPSPSSSPLPFDYTYVFSRVRNFLNRDFRLTTRY